MAALSRYAADTANAFLAFDANEFAEVMRHTEKEIEHDGGNAFMPLFAVYQNRSGQIAVATSLHDAARVPHLLNKPDVTLRGRPKADPIGTLCYLDIKNRGITDSNSADRIAFECYKANVLKPVKGKHFIGLPFAEAVQGTRIPKEIIIKEKIVKPTIIKVKAPKPEPLPKPKKEPVIKKSVVKESATVPVVTRKQGVDFDVLANAAAMIGDRYDHLPLKLIKDDVPVHTTSDMEWVRDYADDMGGYYCDDIKPIIYTLAHEAGKIDRETVGNTPRAAKGTLQILKEAKLSPQELYDTYRETCLKDYTKLTAYIAAIDLKIITAKNDEKLSGSGILLRVQHARPGFGYKPQ